MMAAASRSVTVGALLLMVGASTASGGTGKVRTVGSEKFLDFCVSVRFTATAAQIEDIKQAFTGGSAVLLDATDGQFEFGDVDIVNNSGASREAEVWIHDTAGRAVATYGKYGTPGEHINMYFPSNFQQTPAADGDAYTVAHEFGHHIWSLGDEYQSNSGGAAECEPAPGSATASFCLMDNYFTRGGNMGGNIYTLNEFCVASNHDPDMDTVQEALNGKSCWKTIADHPTRAGTAPAGLPTGGAPTATAPTFREPGAQRRFVELIDRSGSMAIQDGGSGTPTRLDLAKQAANIFIDLTRLNDELGIASFSSSASSNFPLTPITSPAVRTAAKAAVNALTAGGATAIGSGLITARNMMTGAATLSCSKTIILFTDGFGNTGPGELTVVPSLVDNDISVIAIAIGQSVSTANLSSIAMSTGGKFFQVQTAADLPALLASLAAESTGGGVLANQPGFVATGEVEDRTILVDAATSELTVVLTFDPDDNMALSLIAPSGAVIDSAFAAGSPDVEFLMSPGTRILLVKGSAFETGTWILKVEGVSVTDGNFVLTSSSDSIDVSLVPSLEKAEYVFPEPIVIQATPSFHLPIVDANVTAIVNRPDGSAVVLDLLDDGDKASDGDLIAADGIYSAVFNSYAGNGSYRFDVVVETLPGSFTDGGEKLFADAGAPSVETPVPPLRRETSVTAVVSNVPDNAPPAADAGVDQTLECADGSATALLDGSGSSDPDGDIETYEWLEGGIVLATGVQPVVEFALGSHVVTLTVTDSLGQFDTDSVTIVVQDTTPPQLACNVATSQLWPPNHQMIDIGLSVEVSDSCDPAPTVGVSVSSDEHAAEASGAGGPNHCPDALIGESLGVQLRAERSGSGDGRVYVTRVSATDNRGNGAECSAQTVVRLNQGQGGAAVDSGQLYDALVCGGGGGSPTELEAAGDVNRGSGQLGIAGTDSNEASSSDSLDAPSDTERSPRSHQHPARAERKHRNRLSNR